MPNPTPKPFLAVDVGNSRIKIGWFDGIANTEKPVATTDIGSDVLQSDDLLLAAIEDWLEEPIRGAEKSSVASVLGSAWGTRQSTTPWWVGSVNWPLSARLSSAISHLGAGVVHKLSHQNLPLEIRVEAPDRVGIDRLLAATAANQLRDLDRPAIVVDIGTAITVDLVAADGAFEGGAILPGIAMAAHAMARQTDALPHSPIVELDHPPSPIGKSTLSAIESGLFWGAIGAVRELVGQYVAALGAVDGANKTKECLPELFFTGGAAPQVAEMISTDEQPAQHIPHLVLSGIATTAGQMMSSGKWKE